MLYYFGYTFLKQDRNPFNYIALATKIILMLSSICIWQTLFFIFVSIEMIMTGNIMFVKENAVTINFTLFSIYIFSFPFLLISLLLLRFSSTRKVTRFRWTGRSYSSLHIGPLQWGFNNKYYLCFYRRWVRFYLFFYTTYRTKLYYVYL